MLFFLRKPVLPSSLPGAQIDVLASGIWSKVRIVPYKPKKPVRSPLEYEAVFFFLTSQWKALLIRSITQEKPFVRTMPTIFPSQRL